MISRRQTVQPTKHFVTNVIFITHSSVFLHSFPGSRQSGRAPSSRPGGTFLFLVPVLKTFKHLRPKLLFPDRAVLCHTWLNINLPCLSSQVLSSLSPKRPLCTSFNKCPGNNMGFMLWLRLGLMNPLPPCLPLWPPKTQNADEVARKCPDITDRLRLLEQEVARNKEESGRSQAEVERLKAALRDAEVDKSSKEKKIAELERWGLEFHCLWHLLWDTVCVLREQRLSKWPDLCRISNHG